MIMIFRNKHVYFKVRSQAGEMNGETYFLNVRILYISIGPGIRMKSRYLCQSKITMTHETKFQ